jgi:hypothetical protein
MPPKKNRGLQHEARCAQRLTSLPGVRLLPDDVPPPVLANSEDDPADDEPAEVEVLEVSVAEVGEQPIDPAATDAETLLRADEIVDRPERELELAPNTGSITDPNAGHLAGGLVRRRG